MKRYILPIILLCLLVPGLRAQEAAKVGYINSDSLLPYLPGKDSVKALMDNLIKDYGEQLDSMIKNYDLLYEAFRMDSTATSADSGKAAIMRLLTLKNKIKDFKENAETKLRSRQDELLKSLAAKAEKAINEVARENGYIFILDTAKSSGHAVLYAGQSGDITTLVRKKLPPK